MDPLVVHALSHLHLAAEIEDVELLAGISLEAAKIRFRVILLHTNDGRAQPYDPTSSSFVR